MYDKLSFLVRKDAVLKKEEFTQKVAELIELAHKKEADLQLMRFRISLKMMI